MSLLFFLFYRASSRFDSASVAPSTTRTNVTAPISSHYCFLDSHVRFSLVSAQTPTFSASFLRAYLPSTSTLDAGATGEHPRRFRTCGVVSSAGSIEGLGLGAAIDANEAVFRFNQAPTKGFEQDVGTKTTFRFVDSQVVGWPMYGLMEDPIFRQPGNTKSSLIKYLLRFKSFGLPSRLFFSFKFNNKVFLLWSFRISFSRGGVGEK